jgi:hypothetical protein
MGLERPLQNQLPPLAHGLGPPGMHRGRRQQAQPGVVMLVIVS